MTQQTLSDTHIYFEDDGFQKINQYLIDTKPSVIFVLVDQNTHEHCLPLFLEKVATDIRIEIIEIEAGEVHKTIDTCTGVWSAISELGGERNSLLINLGGGVITDLGGFVACTFKRGIPFIQVPTTLLSMVDASIGGKNGVDLDALKNQVGLIQQPNMIVIDPVFLKTLPYQELRSGFAEMLKHGLIYDSKYWKTLTNLKEISSKVLSGFIEPSVQIKHAVVAEDPTEKGLRKILNFGHTLGHAIESYFLTHATKKTLLHGEAIAIGMILEAWLSHKICGLPEKEFNEIANCFNRIYEAVTFENEDIIAVMGLLKHDKKNSHGAVLFALLENIGKPVIDIHVDNKLIINAFNRYNLLQKN
jgi:3-dehydroquinate synthase